MSVYTCINQQQLKGFLAQYPLLGSLVKFSGIQAGIENTNYSVTTSQGEYILTIFETLTATQLPCYLNLLNHLCQDDFPAPSPQLNNSNQFIGYLNAKPAVLFNRLPGYSIENPSEYLCKEIGQYLAKLHISANTVEFDKTNSKDLIGCQALFENIQASLSIKDKVIIKTELLFQTQFSFRGSGQSALSQGLIHADLFKDNVLIKQGEISGILDFYNACQGYFLFDIAVTINDWCIENSMLVSSKLTALLGGYLSINHMTDTEIQHLNVFLRLAALRFWLSRLDHQIHPKAGELILQKDPLQFRQILLNHQAREEVYELCLPA